ncbi:geraniol 8-hydroxylase-like [Tasmannia lanceolata]|uniref:geraniol 8-hydroxylase-like n=1 Tax=Tasmannia lanceolata TaxID=3420 RepID=UPI0040644838
MDYSTLVLWISLVCSCIHVFNLLARKQSCKGKLPPGPVPLPIVGNLFKLGDKPNESLAELAKTYGPLMTLQLGRVTTVVVCSAKMAKEVLQKNDQAFAGRTVLDAVRALRHNEASMVFLNPNPYWKKLRMLSNTQIFTSQRLDSNEGLRRQKVQQLVSHIGNNCTTGRAVDIGRAAFACTLNLLSNTTFSVDLVDPNSESAHEFKDVVWKLMEVVGKPNLSDYFPLLRPIDLQGIRRRSTALLKKIHEYFDGLIQERLLYRASSNSPRMNDFLDTLLDHKENDDDKFDIKALLTDLFVAGSETSSNTIEFAMAELLHSPQTMAKARSELLQTIILDQQVEESDIARLPYLLAVVKETLRLHPPVPLMIPHRAESNVDICGFTIPKNTQVLVNAWGIGRDADIWPNPNAFIPERFLGSQVDFRGQDFELIPFGSGRRICPGLPLAYRMVHLMLASLLHSFSWKLPDEMSPEDMDMRYKFGLTLQRAVPLCAIPIQD